MARKLRDPAQRKQTRRVIESQQPEPAPRSQRADTAALLDAQLYGASQQGRANEGGDEEAAEPSPSRSRPGTKEPVNSEPESEVPRTEYDEIEVNIELKAVGSQTTALSGRGVEVIRGTTLPMSAFTRPYNEIDEDKLEEQNKELYRLAASWASLHITMPDSPWLLQRKLSWRAEISGTGKQPVLIDLDYGSCDQLKKVYEYVRHQAHNFVRREVRCQVVYYCRLEPCEPIAGPVSQQRKRPRAGTFSVSPPRRESATERRKRDESETQTANKATGNHVGEITKEWKCYNKQCANFERVCLTVPEMGRYIPLNTHDVRRWAKEIRDKKGTVRDCPVSLRQEWVLRLQETTLNVTARSAEKKASNSWIEGLTSPLVVVQNSNPFGSASSGQQPHFDNIRSSPPPLEFGTPIENLEEFLQWLEQEGKVAPRFVQAARIGLEEEGHTWETLKSVTDAEWQGMGVKSGPMIAIRKGMKVFATVYLRKKLNEVKRTSPVSVSSDSRPPTADNNKEVGNLVGRSRVPHSP